MGAVTTTTAVVSRSTAVGVCMSRGIATLPGTVQPVSLPSTRTVTSTMHLSLQLGVPPISPTDLDFGASLTSLTATINTGDANGAWSVSESIPWLSLSSGSGTGAATVTATVDRAGLPKGVYTGTIDAVVGGEAVTVDVSMRIAHQVYLPLVQRGNH